MDFNQFKAEMMQKYEDRDVDIAMFSRVAVVKFARDTRGNISGKCRFGLVYRHRDYEDSIKEGETWVCELMENYAANGQYFARGLEKVDSAFLMDLRADQLKLVAESIWENSRESVENMMYEQYGNIIDEKVDSIVSERMQPLEEERKVMQERLNSLRAENCDLMKGVESYDNALQSMKKEKEELESRVRELEERIQSGIVRTLPTVSDGVMDDPLCVVRVADDTLYSKSFSKGMYSVRVSADKHLMTVIPDDSGDIECRDGMMKFNNLCCILENGRNVFRFQPDMRSITVNA